MEKKENAENIENIENIDKIVLNKSDNINSLNIVRSALNNATLNGSYNLKEAGSLLLAIDELTSYFEGRSTKTNNELLQFIIYISNSLNKGCKNGTFTMDEAYVIKVATQTIFDELNKK